MDNSSVLAALAALAQSTRLDVFRLLVRAGPDGCAAGDIAAALDTRQNTLSTHLKLLSGAGLVTAARDGRRIVYRADFDTMRDLLLYLLEDCCAGSPRVCQPVAAMLSEDLAGCCPA